ncbi:MAG: bifunctional chorismate mutase/prephenate dehydrogenase [Cyanophyceae cyanobacterium]
MLPELQKIDRELIELLGQRIALLKASQACDAVDTSHLLAQAGVPEYVWQHLTLGCAAASVASPTPAIAQPQPRRVTIIGGRGQMGRFFAQQLTAAGHCVQAIGRHDWQRADELLKTAELVIVCVPIAQTLAAIEQAAKYLQPDTVLVDLTSIKTSIVQAMLDHHSGPVLGLHPMFGPGVQSFLSQNVVVCVGRRQEAGQWFLDLIASRGGKLIYCTPQEHDRIMTVVQAIRHFWAFSLGVFLAEQGIDVLRSLDFSSPLYRLQLNIVSRLFAQDASLSLKMMLATAERRHAIRDLATVCSRLAEMIGQEDEAGLGCEFEATSRFFHQEAKRALCESNHTINSLSVLLAASETSSGQES